MVPTTFAELVPEKFVKAIWEDQHSGRYSDALKRAALIDFNKHQEGWKVFQTIVRAIEAAYLVNVVGIELLPKPKVNILHRGLSLIGARAGLKGQTITGFAEFLDSLCPCGLLDHREAVRKLWSRSSNTRRS